MANAYHIIYRKGSVLHKAETPWNGVHPPKFGPVGDQRDGWCKPVDLGVEPREGDIVICEFEVIQTNRTWASEEQHVSSPSVPIKNYWHYTRGAFKEVTKEVIKILAKLAHKRSVKGDPSGQFYVRVPCDDDGYRDDCAQGNKRALFPSRRAARNYCLSILNADPRVPQIVHPCGGIETVEYKTHVSTILDGVKKRNWSVKSLEPL